MTRPRISSIAALALLAALLLGAPVSASAKPKSREHVLPATSIASFTTAGSGGWHLYISTATYGGKPNQTLGISAAGPDHETVLYEGIKAKGTEDGGMVAKVPGLGRIDVEFDQTSEKTLHLTTGKVCTAEAGTVVRKGVFRGTIEFHGEGGYTTVTRRSAPGQIIEAPKEVCTRPRHKSPRHAPDEKEEAQEAEELSKIKLLIAGRDLGNGQLTFSAFSSPAPAPFPTSQYTASYIHTRGALTIFATTVVSARGNPGTFSMTAPEGKPTEATLKPPAPFTGTGNFKVESPTTTSWTGDLSVEVPTLGKVSLTEGFWSDACAIECTSPLPGEQQVITSAASRLP